jgi:hypothetical protein
VSIYEFTGVERELVVATIKLMRLFLIIPPERLDEAIGPALEQLLPDDLDFDGELNEEQKAKLISFFDHELIKLAEPIGLENNEI